MEPTARLSRRVHEDFAGDDAELVMSLLRDLAGMPGPAVGERVQAAVVKLSLGDLSRLDAQLAEVRMDWRDVLVAAGFAGEDWRERLDEYLGPEGLRA